MGRLLRDHAGVREHTGGDVIMVLCPMKFANFAAMVAQGATDLMQCDREECAWWIKHGDEGRCAIKENAIR